MEYGTGTAIQFVLFAVVFAVAFMYAAWRIVRKFEKDDDQDKP